MTTSSLASALNLDYLSTLVDEYNISIAEPKYVIRHSRVRSFLEARGYQSVSIDSGWENTIIRNTDYYLHTGYAVQSPLSLDVHQ